MSNRRWRDIPQDERNGLVLAAHELREKRTRWADIARALNVSVNTIRRGADPDFRLRCREQERAKARRYRADAKTSELRRLLHKTEGGPRGTEIFVRLAEIPPDHRSLTGRVFGDPLPGRSALEKGHAR